MSLDFDLSNIWDLCFMWMVRVAWWCVYYCAIGFNRRYFSQDVCLAWKMHNAHSGFNINMQCTLHIHKHINMWFTWMWLTLAGEFTKIDRSSCINIISTWFDETLKWTMFIWIKLLGTGLMQFYPLTGITFSRVYWMPSTLLHTISFTVRFGRFTKGIAIIRLLVCEIYVYAKSKAKSYENCIKHWWL